MSFFSLFCCFSFALKKECLFSESAAEGCRRMDRCEDSIYKNKLPGKKIL